MKRRKFIRNILLTTGTTTVTSIGCSQSNDPSSEKIANKSKDNTHLTEASTVHLRDKLYRRAMTPQMFGAISGNSANDAGAFQSLIESVPNGSKARFIVPEGTYIIDTPLSAGNRVIVWRFLGNVYLKGTAPQLPGTIEPHPSYSPNAGDYGSIKFTIDGTKQERLPWFIDHNASNSGDRAPLRVDRKAEYNDASEEDPDTHNAIWANTIVGENNKDQEWGILSTIDNKRTQDTGSDSVAIYGRAENNGVSSTFASCFETDDYTSDNTCIGIEVNIGATGTTSGNRVISQFVAKTHAGTTKATLQRGIDLRTADGDQVADLEKGIFINQPSTGNIKTGIEINAKHNGGEAIKIKTQSSAGTLTIGSDRNGVGKVEGIVNFNSINSAGNDFTHASIESIPTENTDGSERGRLDLNFRYNGHNKNGIRIWGDSPGSPVFLRVSSSLKQVTQGAEDSGGKGYRVLRVEN